MSGMALPAMAERPNDGPANNSSPRMRDVHACAVKPDRDCVAEIVFALEVRGDNDFNRAMVAERLAIAGRFDLAMRLAELVHDQTREQRVLQIIAQRRIAENAVTRPDTVANLADLDTFDRGEGPVAVETTPMGNSPFLEITSDIIGHRPYGLIVGYLDEYKSHLSSPHSGNATLGVLLPRWRDYADRLPGPRRVYELQALAQVQKALGDQNGAIATLDEAVLSASGSTYAVVAGGWLRLGQTNKALSAAKKLPEADPNLFVRLANALLNNGEPREVVMHIVRDALSVIYRDDLNTNFVMVRSFVGITGRAGSLEEARDMIRDGAKFARTSRGIKWSALTLLAASSIDIGDRETARALLTERSQLTIPDLFRTLAFGDIAVQFYRLGDIPAFQVARGAMPAAEQWTVWPNVLRENAVPGDPLLFAREISSGLPAGQQLVQYSNIGRRLVEDGRTEEARNILRLGLDIAELTPQGIDSRVYDLAAAFALNAGDVQLAERAIRNAIGAAMIGPTPALYLSYKLAVWRDQLGREPAEAK